MNFISRVANRVKMASIAHYVVITDLLGLCYGSSGQKCSSFDFCIVFRVLLAHFIVLVDIIYDKNRLPTSSKVQQTSGLFYSL